MTLQEMRDANPNRPIASDDPKWEQYLQDPRMWIQDLGVVDGANKFVAHVCEIETEAHAPHAVDPSDGNNITDEVSLWDCGFCQYHLEVMVRMQKRFTSGKPKRK